MTYQPSGPKWMQAAGVELMREYDALTRAIQAGESHYGNIEVEKLLRRMLRGIVIARIDGLTPPIAVGDKLVCMLDTKPVRCPYENSHFVKGCVTAVRDFTYDCEHGWIFIFPSRSDFEFYKVTDFERLEEPAPAETPA